MPLLAQELGFPWVMRKCAIKYGSQSTDIVLQKGGMLSVTSVNAKASWTRALQEGRDTTVVRALPAPPPCKGCPESGLTPRGGIALCSTMPTACPARPAHDGTAGSTSRAWSRSQRRRGRA